MNNDFEERFRIVLTQIEETGNLYAEAKAASWKSQELVSSVRASIQNGYKDMAVSKSELLAKEHPDYLAHIDETAQAIKKELVLKAKYEMLKSKFEAYRSLSSLEKRTQELIG